MKATQASISFWINMVSFIGSVIFIGTILFDKGIEKQEHQPCLEKIIYYKHRADSLQHLLNTR